MNTTAATLPKGTRVRVTAENQARVPVGTITRIVARFELTEAQGGRHYRVTSTRTAAGFGGKLIPATALEETVR